MQLTIINRFEIMKMGNSFPQMPLAKRPGGGGLVNKIK